MPIIRPVCFTTENVFACASAERADTKLNFMHSHGAQVIARHSELFRVNAAAAAAAAGTAAYSA